MSKKKRFYKSSKKKRLSEEDRLKRRALVFGFLTIVTSVGIIFFGIPLFFKLVGYLGDLKSEQNQEIEQDTIPPQIPRLTYIPDATNSSQLTVAGFTEPKATVKVKLNDNQVETQANEEGDFEVQKMQLNKGENTLTAWAEDSADNQSDPTEEISINYDTTPPDLEIIEPDSGTVADEQTIEIKGETEPNARVLVNEAVVIVGQEGKFTTRLTLQEGENKISVVAQDSAGNETEEELTVTYFL